jgi:hypothetical protein
MTKGQDLADIDAAEGLIDMWLLEGEFEIGDRIAREGNPVTILLLETVPDPGDAIDASLIFSRNDGHLYRLVGGKWTPEAKLFAERNKETPQP